MAGQDMNTSNITPVYDHLLTFRETAAMLKVSLSLIEAAQATGRLLIPIVRPTARRSCFRASDVQRIVRGEIQLCTPETLTESSTKRIRESDKQKKAAALAETEAANA
jgi:hypothetical protein